MPQQYVTIGIIIGIIIGAIVFVNGHISGDITVSDEEIDNGDTINMTIKLRSWTFGSEDYMLKFVTDEYLYVTQPGSIDKLTNYELKNVSITGKELNLTIRTSPYRIINKKTAENIVMVVYKDEQTESKRLATPFITLGGD